MIEWDRMPIFEQGFFSSCYFFFEIYGQVFANFGFFFVCREHLNFSTVCSNRYINERIMLQNSAYKTSLKYILLTTPMLQYLSKQKMAQKSKSTFFFCSSLAF